jgi:hypothetical protein
MTHCPSNDIKIILRDWNANVGREEIYRRLIVEHTCSMHLHTNNNGQKIVDFARSNKNTAISSNCFPHNEIHKQTWRSTDGKTNNKIDHILIDRRKSSNMVDVKSCTGASSDSDHYLVRGMYRGKTAYNKYEPNRTTAGMFHKDVLREAITVRRFQQQLEEEFGNIGS